MDFRRGPRSGVILFVLLVTWFPSASGMEVNFQGRYVWDYVAYAQLGARGFFGPYNIDNGSPIPGGAASTNGWLGYRITSLMTSGTDAANSTMAMCIDTVVKLHDAIDIKGRYQIGGWGFSRNVSDVKFPAQVSPKHWDPVGNLTNSSYSTMTVPGVNQSFSSGYWNTLWVTARSPWGIIVIGKRPFKFGPGLMFNGADNASTETVLVVVPAGPLRFGIGCYPWRRIIDQGYVEPSRISHQYYNPLDKSSGRRYDVTGFVTYDSGPMSLGVLNQAYAFTLGPEALNDPADRRRFLPQRLEAMLGAAFLKYFAGGIFLNAELDWYYENNCLQPNANGNLTPAFSPIVVQGALTANPLLFRKSYVEHMRCMVEFGLMIGPAKLSAIWSRIPGPDMRGGIVIDRQSSFYDDLLTNTGLFMPYSMILVNGYGTGNNSLSAITNSGYLSDANAYGARLDYALAANLNCFATFFWADRVAQGYTLGFIRPARDTDIPDPTPVTNGVATGFVEYIRNGSLADPAPLVPVRHIGYEVDCGFGWKLFEGYTLNANFGIFQPGDWFKFACVDRSNPGWKTPARGNNYGTNPDREIDPVFAMDISLNVEF